MLGTAHILMIRHGLYASLPHRRGEGGTGTVTDPKQELRRQLRIVRRNPNLTAALFLLQTGLLQIGDDPDFAALRQLHANRRACEGNTSPPWRGNVAGPNQTLPS
jgi:hypothetical protein